MNGQNSTPQIPHPLTDYDKTWQIYNVHKSNILTESWKTLSVQTYGNERVRFNVPPNT